MVFISGELQIYANQNGQWLYNCLFQNIKPWTSNCQVESLNYHCWNFFSKCISKMYDFSREKFTRLFINLMTFIPGYVATRKTSCLILRHAGHGIVRRWSYWYLRQIVLKLQCLLSLLYCSFFPVDIQNVTYLYENVFTLRLFLTLCTVETHSCNYGVDFEKQTIKYSFYFM